MHYYEIAPAVIVRNDSSTLTYHSDELIHCGQIVQISIGKRHVTGLVVKKVKKPSFDTKAIINIITTTPLPDQLIRLSNLLSDYYHAPMADVIRLILPSGITKKRRQKLQTENTVFSRDRTNFLLNNQQTKALNTINSQKAGTTLLQGITGSGKTAVYIELIRKIHAQGASAIVLVPEISLTPQMIGEFNNHFSEVYITHSKMTEAARHQVWLKILTTKKPILVIGPRSALFMPIQKIGAIIIDEEHEPSYKQESSPKYSTITAAIILGKLHNAKVVLGSATPSITDRYLAEQSKAPIAKIDKKATPDAKVPTIQLIDMSKRQSFHKHRFLSDILIDSISQSLQSKHQVLLYHNRRGSTHTSLCRSCGWIALCPRCNVPMKLHIDNHALKCHVCNHETQIPNQCPECKSADIVHKGIGTKLIEQEVSMLFPDAKIARFDSDTDAKNKVEKMYKELYKGEIDIIIGTQSIAKGLDLPNLDTVGVIQADAGLCLPDFTTEERTFQLIAQVMGRVGRNSNDSRVIIQTYQPDHPSIKYGIRQDYDEYYRFALASRKQKSFPPFVFLLKVNCKYKTEATAIRNIKKLADHLRKNKDIVLFGPSPAFYEYQNGFYKWQLIIKSKKRSNLLAVIDQLPNSPNWQYDIDPASLL